MASRSTSKSATSNPRSTVKFQGSLKALRILDRQGPLAQSHIAHDLGVSAPAALSHFRKLDQEGLVVAVDKKVSTGRGRPLELWDVDRSRNFTIGILVTPPALVIAMSDFADNIVLQEQHDVADVKSSKAIELLVHDFIAKAKAYLSKTDYTLRSACACMSGPANMPILPEIDFDGVFAEYDIPSISTVLAASMVFGEAKRFDFETTVCVVDWDFGVGVVPCCGDRVLFFEDTTYTVLDAKRKLCDFGHQRIEKNGRQCQCGRRGCLEAYAGGHAIIKQLGRSDIQSIEDLREAAQSGDAEVLKELAIAAHYIGSALSQFVLLMGIDKIVFAGVLNDVFDLVRDDFCAGLADYLEDSEIKGLDPSASSDPLGSMVTGSCRAARHLFLHSDVPDEHGLISYALPVDFLKSR